MRKIIKSVLTENGQYSLTRIITVILLLAFLAGSAYLIIRGQTWGNYDSFATFCGGGGVAGQMANKWINSRYNTPPGGVGKPTEGGDRHGAE